MNKNLIPLLILAATAAQAANYDLYYLQERSDGKTEKRTVTLTPGTYLSVDSVTGKLQVRTVSQVRTDLSLNNVENAALSTWAGSTNLTTLASGAARNNLSGGSGTLNLSLYTVTLPSDVSRLGSTIDLGTSEVAGILSIANGGTGSNTAAGGFGNIKQAASTSATGVVQIATNTEVQAETDSLKAVVPSSLSAWWAAKWTSIKAAAQTIAGAWTFAGNLITQGNFTGGDASGDSATLNWGSVTAPNLPGITQRGYAMLFPDAAGRFISSGNPQDFATVAQPIFLSVADTYRSVAAFNVNSVLIATGGKTVVGQGSGLSGYTQLNTVGPGDMVAMSFGDVGTSFASGGQFPLTRKLLVTGRFSCAPYDSPYNNGRFYIWFGEPLKYGIAISSVTRSGTTATATSTNHRLSSGEWVKIYGATESEYNGYFQISNTTANTFDYTVSGTPSTPATGAPKFDANKGYGFGIVADASGARLAGTTSTNTYVETSAATGLAAFQNYNYHSRFFWLYWNGDGTASLYLADQATGSNTVPARPASPSLTMSGLPTTGIYTPRTFTLTTSYVGTVASPGNQGGFGLSNLWLFTL